MKVMRLFYIVFLLGTCAIVNGQSNSSDIQMKCNQEITALQSKLSNINSEWENIKDDLKAGLFCSKCNGSKTELDKTEGFYTHLGNVKGTAVPATQAQMDAAYQKYLNKFNSAKDQLDRKRQSCQENYTNAVNSENRRLQQEREDQQRAQQDAFKQRQAEADRRFQEEQRQQEMEKQRVLAELEQQRIQYQQSVLEQSAKIKQDITNTFQQEGDRIKSGISNVKDYVDNTGNIGFNNQGISGIGYTGSRGNSISADEFINDNEAESISDKVRNIYEKYSSLFETNDTRNDFINDCEDCFSTPTSSWQDAKDLVTGYVSDKFSDDIVESLSDKYPRLGSWYNTYSNYAPLVDLWLTNAGTAKQTADDAWCLVNKQLENGMGGEFDDEQSERDFYKFQENLAFSLPVAGKLGKAYKNLNGFYEKMKTSIFGND